MAKSVQGARILMRRSTTSGVSPTIPPNDDHTFGWLTTDIYKSELYMNTADNKVYTRSDLGIAEVILTNPSTGKIDTSYMSVPIDNNTANALLMSSGGTDSIIAISALTYDTSTTTLSLLGTGKFTTLYEGGSPLSTLYIQKTGTQSFTSTLNYTPDSGNILTMDSKEIIKRHNISGGLSISSGNGSGSNLLIGNGDAVTKGESNLTISSGEEVYIISDSNIYFYTNTNIAWASRKTAYFNTAGIFDAPSIKENGTLLDDKYLRANTDDTFTGSALTIEGYLLLTGLSATTQDTILGINTGTGNVTEMEVVLDYTDNRMLTSTSNPCQVQAETTLTYNGVTMTMSAGGSTYTQISKGAVNVATSAGDCNYTFTTGFGTSNIRYSQTYSPVVGLVFNVGGSDLFLMAEDGFIYGNNSPISTPFPPSDIRLKNIESNLTTTLDDMLKLDTIKYTWNKDTMDKDVHFGLIAQDVEKYFPETVKESPMPFHSDDGQLYKTIDYNSFVPIIINSMKEQQQIINDLKKEIEILKNK